MPERFTSSYYHRLGRLKGVVYLWAYLFKKDLKINRPGNKVHRISKMRPTSPADPFYVPVVLVPTPTCVTTATSGKYGFIHSVQTLSTIVFFLLFTCLIYFSLQICTEKLQ